MELIFFIFLSFILLECEFNFSEPPSKGESEHFVDGVFLSESGFSHLNSLLSGMDATTFTPRKKKRCNLSDQGGSDQGIMDSIESVVAAGTHSLPIFCKSYFVFFFELIDFGF